MASDPRVGHEPGEPGAAGAVEMPRPTVAPMVLSLGLALTAAGVATSPAFLVVGGVILAIGLGLWIGQLLPGRGHVAEPLIAPERGAPVGAVGAVERLEVGSPGYRLRLPERVHPISAGVKGGIVGGLVMPVPALAYGLLSGHGIWYPINLLAGIVLPGVGRMGTEELRQFHLTLLVLGFFIHAIMSVVVGLIYGVLLPTLPPIPKPLAWGGLLMPLLWTATSFALMRVADPLLARGVDWPWFIASQFFFGVAAALVVMRAGKLGSIRAGFLGGIVGGLLMPLPAIVWGLSSGRGIWYPANLLAAMVRPGMGKLAAGELTRFRADWLVAAAAVHVFLSAGFGLVYGLLLPRLRRIPGSLAWGGLLMPLLWTAMSYGLMGVVNPLLQRRVDWPWFVASQFVFGVVASMVVHRSEEIPVPPVGHGPGQEPDRILGSFGGQP